MTAGYHELVARLLGRVPEVTVEELAERDGDLPILIDVREPAEVRSGYIPGAVHVPRGVLESSVERLDRDAEVVLYCSAGNRSVLAAASMQDMGFTRVSSLAGGTIRWRMAGRPIVMPGAVVEQGAAAPVPSADDAARYARHLTLPEVGPTGQAALGAGSVLVVGAGGLGSPAAMYLAAAGVGRIGLADPDVVDVSNLQRQVIHDTTGLGSLKVESATATLRRLNPSVVVEPHADLVTAANVVELMSGFDVVIDAADNFPTRYLLNDASLHTRVPVVHGSVFRFEGQVTVFRPYEGPCYRCLFPQPPPPELAPDCAAAGVLGSVTGIIGSIQATEALKLILGVGESLSGTLLTVDTLTQDWARLSFGRDPDCPACRDDMSPPVLVDYDAACLPVAR